MILLFGFYIFLSTGQPHDYTEITPCECIEYNRVLNQKISRANSEREVQLMQQELGVLIERCTEAYEQNVDKWTEELKNCR